MGWKNVKEHYRIGHMVQVNENGICIGSPYINNIIVIDPAGKVSKRYDDRSNDGQRRYQSEMDGDPEKLKQLVLAPDAFSAAHVVYTYDGGGIVAKKCETLGWPNVTHDGCVMYENTFSTDHEKIVLTAKNSADRRIKWSRDHVAEAEIRLSDCRARLAIDEADRAKLEADYPTASITSAPPV